MAELAETMQIYGGWGVSAILLFILVGMAKYIVRMVDERRHDDKLMVAALVEVKQSLQAIRDELKEWRK